MGHLGLHDCLQHNGSESDDDLSLDISAVMDHLAEKPSYVVKFNNEDWLKINFDTGASTTAIPAEMVKEPKEKDGEGFRVANGAHIPNFGRYKVFCKDEDDDGRNFKASCTHVHKPLGSAAEFTTNHDVILLAEGGALLPKDGPVAKGLRQAYEQLVAKYGKCKEIPLYREGNLYNFYLKMEKEPQELNANESTGSGGADAKPSSGFHRQARL